MHLGKYLSVWKALSYAELQETFINRWSNALFLLGKVFRLAMSLLFLFIIKNTVTSFAGYTSDQIVIFYLTYQIVDVLGQTLYRGVYIFSNKVRSGEFDFTLVKPISSLFQSLVGKPDFNDALFMIPTIGISFYLLSTLDIAITTTSFLLYLALLINSFLIVTALHVLVLTIGVLTTEVDGVIWMYRDLSALGRFPVSIYMQPLRFALFFIIPVGMMISVPAEVLLNTAPTHSILLTNIVGISFFFISLRLWNWSLKQYSSASS